MPNRVCYECHAYTHLHRVSEPSEVPIPGIAAPTARWQIAFVCDGCGAISVATWRRDDEVNWPSTVSAARSLDARRDPDLWAPLELPSPPFPDVPRNIAETAQEAHKCLGIGALRSAVGTARSVIEATAKERGIADGQIASKIGQLVDQEHLGPLIKEQAHTIRLFGNDAMHGDKYVEPLSQAEADEVLEIMDQVLERIYSMPASLLRLKTRRESLRGAEPAES